ncbi:MAG: radical SAM protein [Kiritimatiellae bacterium]|nr:radical SAM protein [Kiritimatiellia bacterium]
MQDPYQRTIDYLRISLTDRSNLRGSYTMPLKYSEPVPEDRLLTVDEIVKVVRVAVKYGFRKFRLTGGEPLLRPDVVKIVEVLAPIGGVDDLSMTTNGTLLAEMAKSLAHAGLKRVNVGLNTMDPNRFAAMTQGGDLYQVVAGVCAAAAAGLKPIRLNCMVERSSREKSAQEVARFAAEHGFEVRFARRMNFLTGEFWPVEGGQGGHCAKCNRLRLSCDGAFHACLFSAQGFSIRKLGVETALKQAIEAKPESGRSCSGQGFYAVGG